MCFQLFNNSPTKILKGLQNLTGIFVFPEESLTTKSLQSTCLSGSLSNSINSFSKKVYNKNLHVTVFYSGVPQHSRFSDLKYLAQPFAPAHSETKLPCWFYTDTSRSCNYGYARLHLCTDELDLFYNENTEYDFYIYNIAIKRFEFEFPKSKGCFNYEIFTEVV